MFQLLFFEPTWNGKEGIKGELKGLIQFKKLVLAWQVVKMSKWIQSQPLPRDLAQGAACQDVTACAVSVGSSPAWIWSPLFQSVMGRQYRSETLPSRSRRRRKALGWVPTFKAVLQEKPGRWVSTWRGRCLCRLCRLDRRYSWRPAALRLRLLSRLIPAAAERGGWCWRSVCLDSTKGKLKCNECSN